MHRLPAWKFTAHSRELFNVRAFLHPLVDFHTALKVVWKSTVGVSERQDPCLCCLSLGDALVPHLSSTLVAALAMKWGKWSSKSECWADAIAPASLGGTGPGTQLIAVKCQDRSQTQADTPCIRAMPWLQTWLSTTQLIVREAVIRETRSSISCFCIPLFLGIRFVFYFSSKMQQTLLFTEDCFILAS